MKRYSRLIDKYTKKGSLIGIEGRIEVYNTESNGNYEKRVNVNVQSISLLESKKSNENRGQKASPEPRADKREDESFNEKSSQHKNETMPKFSEEKENDDFDFDFDDITF